MSMFNLANILTSCNLICGLTSITFCFAGQLDLAAYAIFVGALFDFADGFVARSLKLESEIRCARKPTGAHQNQSRRTRK